MDSVYLGALAFAALINTGLAILTYITTREVKHATNSMKDELVAVTRSDAHQRGVIQGRAMQKSDDIGSLPKT